MLLSSVAERVYWMSRYIERAENTARIILVNHNLLLDMPRTKELGWEPLVAIMGSREAFYEHHAEATERNVIRYLVSDPHNPNSLVACLAQARENLRTTRAIVPRSAWETLNDTYAYASENKATATTRRGRYAYLRHIIDYCHMLGGKLSGTMSHDQTYDFLRMGRNMERADMTTRVIDVRGSNLLPTHSEELKPFDDIQWKSVLDSLAGYQMYRRYVHVRVRGVEVLRYLLQDIYFPRAIHHCFNQAEQCLRNLPMNEAPQYALVRAQRLIRNAKVENLVHANLNEFINQLQLAIIDINAELTSTYFEGKEVSPALYYSLPRELATA